ncbi:MAG: TadE/TadG family type IV pilus assembly protein [Bradyrhizobium sp.]|uniref:TadE/TadG family type IV pilus assembly protein n=1 Tax=Bradyrhizobium sp. TaxID=376 RepID=UPI002A31F4B5|nr:pilus assembly protein [Bradyrhizobium sp.]
MSASASKRILRRFRRNDRGSAAVEFSLVAVPFFALLFAIIETGIVFFASQVLENGVQDSGRLIYTNQITNTNTTVAQFKADLCNRVSVLMNCSNIDVDVKYYPAGTAITITDPIDGAGNYDNSGLGFNVPPANSNGTVVVRAFYRWPLYVTGLGYNIANIGRNTANAKRLLSGLSAFHIEPS